jgi:hypothetical protein
MELYHNGNALDVDSFSTHSNGTNGQPQKKGEGNCKGKNGDIGYKSTPVIGTELYKEIHSGINPWTQMDIQWMRRQG